MMGSRECQLGLGMNISNIGSKISFYGDDESQFLPANMRLGASLMIPIDKYNRFSIAADANKLLVPTVPTQKEGESNSDYQDRVRREYSDVSSISGIFKSFSDAPGGFKEELEEIQWVWVRSMSITISSRCVQVITIRQSQKVILSISRLVVVSA